MTDSTTTRPAPPSAGVTGVATARPGTTDGGPDVVDAPTGGVDDLARALYGLSALRRDLQRCAGIEHAVAGLAMLSVVRRIGPARISDVAHESQVDLSVASRQIQALQDEGFVDRVADPHDRRSSLIAISAAGEAKLGRAHARLTDTIAEATEDWRADEVAGLADGLVRLRIALGDEHDGPATPDGAGAVSAHAVPSPGVAPTSPPATSAAAAHPTLRADRPAADPTLTSAEAADARHEEHTR